MDGVVPAPPAPPGAAAGQGAPSTRAVGVPGSWGPAAPPLSGPHARRRAVGAELCPCMPSGEWAQRTRFLWWRPRALRGAGQNFRDREVPRPAARAWRGLCPLQIQKTTKKAVRLFKPSGQRY